MRKANLKISELGIKFEPGIFGSDNKKTNPLESLFLNARGQGFEPRLAGPEPAVLPLDDPRKVILLNHI
mgnify:FL=1